MMNLATIQEDLIDQDVFDGDAIGYAASAAAVELLDHWANCDPPLTTNEKIADVSAVIEALRTWRGKHVAEGGL